MLRQDSILKIEELRNNIIKSCSKCKGLGYIIDRKNNTWDNCSCIVEFQIQRKILENIPPAYHKLELEDFKNKKDKAYQNTIACIQNLDKCRKDGIWVYYQGSGNTGKTLLAVAILKSAIRKGYSVMFCTITDLVNGVGDEEFRQEFSLTDFLIIDSLDLIFKGSTGSQDKISTILESMLRDKALNNTVCIFTSRYSTKKLREEERLSEKVCDLIEGKVAPITIEDSGYKKIIGGE